MKTFFATNRNNKTAVALQGFSCFEEVQCAFRCGIAMPDGTMANGIGRCASHADFLAKATHGNLTVLSYDEKPLVLMPQPAPSFSNRPCVDCGEWSASGGSRCEDCAEDAMND